MKIIVFILLVLVAGIVPETAEHNINLTVADIQYKDKKLHMKIKFFADDLQGVLTNYCKAPVDLINAPIKPREGSIVKYIATRLEMTLNGIPVKWNFKKAYLMQDVIFVEYESSPRNLKKINTVKVKDILLFDDFPEQKNIVNLNFTGTPAILSFSNEQKDAEKTTQVQ